MESTGGRDQSEDGSNITKIDYELTKEEHLLILKMLFDDLSELDTKIEKSLTNNHVQLSQ